MLSQCVRTQRLLAERSSIHRLQTNTLGPELLALLLLLTLRKTELDTWNGPALRFDNVSNSGYCWTSLDEDLINSPTILQKLPEAAYCIPA